MNVRFTGSLQEFQVLVYGLIGGPSDRPNQTDMSDKSLTEAISTLVLALKANTALSQTALEWFKSHFETVTLTDLKEMERRLIMTQTELSAALDKMTAQTGKIAKEQSDRFDTLTAEIEKLKKLIEEGAVKEEVQRAFENVQAALNNMDAAIPDA